MVRDTTMGVLGLSLLLMCRTAVAGKDCPERPDDESEARTLAGEHFDCGEDLYKNRKYDAALAAFLCSLRLTEHENTVLNIAACLKNTPRKKAALDPLRDYIRDNPDTPSAAELRSLIRSAEASIGVPHVDLPEPTARESREEPPQIAPKPEPAATLPESAPNREEPESADEPRKRSGKGRSILAWTAIGFGAGGLLACPVLLGLGSKAKSDADSANTYAQFTDSRNSMHDLRTGGYVALAAGGALAVTGVVLLLLPDTEERRDASVEASVELSWDISPRGMALTGRF